MFILGAIVGALLGIVFTSYAVQEEQRINSVLRKTINSLEDDLKDASLKSEELQKRIKKLKELVDQPKSN